MFKTNSEKDRLLTASTAEAAVESAAEPASESAAEEASSENGSRP